MATKILQIGDIVSLNSHPFTENLTNITISGDSQLIPPLLIVSEILYENSIPTEKLQSASESSLNIKEYKCIWYSHKSQKFEEDWFKPFLLKLIASNTTSINPGIEQGSNVALKTLKLELGKLKSSLAYDENSNSSISKVTSTTALLSFLSPVMLVLGVERYTHKQKDIKNLKYAEHIVKCKWFNPKSEKFSEIFLPLDCLQYIEPVKNEILELINSTILKSKYFIAKFEKNLILAKPISVAFRSGLYYLRYFDYLKNEANEILINNLKKIKVINFYHSAKAPIYDFSKGAKPVTDVKNLISEAIKKNSYVRIKYKNRNDKLSIRTISKYKLEEINDSGKKATYLTGFCLTKKALRSFNIERIQQIEQLVIDYKKKK